MLNKFGYIYITTNNINGKCYIGQHKASKFEPKYKGSGIKLQEDLKKFGTKVFSVQLIEWCNSQSQLDEREKFWIQHFSANNNPKFYNIALGGSGGDSFYYGPFRESHRQRLSQALKGRTPWNKGLTVESDDRIKKHCYNFKGKFHTAEAKQIMSIKHLRENLSESTIQKMKDRRNATIALKGRCFWVNNGCIETIVNQSEYNTISDTFVIGRLPDMLYMYKGSTTVKVHKDSISEYLMSGYDFGKSSRICNNISKSRRLYTWHYLDKVFESSKDLTIYLRNNGFPNITFSTVTLMARGVNVASYPTLSGNIYKVCKGECV